MARTTLGSALVLSTQTEAAWELAKHRYLYIVQQTEHAGYAMHTLFVNDRDVLIAQIENEIGFGGAPR